MYANITTYELRDIRYFDRKAFIELTGYCPVSQIDIFKNHEDWFYLLQKTTNR